MPFIRQLLSVMLLAWMSSARVCDTKINSFWTASTIGIPVPAVYLYTDTNPSLVA
jgi:hypothetical protein